MEFPPKCKICYYNNVCSHKNDPTPTKGCHTHKRNCEIWASNNPTTGREGTCTCGFQTFDFNRYFSHYYTKTLGSKTPSEQPVLTVFCRENGENGSVDTQKKSSVFAEKQRK